MSILSYARREIGAGGQTPRVDRVGRHAFGADSGSRPRTRLRQRSTHHRTPVFRGRVGEALIMQGRL